MDEVDRMEDEMTVYVFFLLTLIFLLGVAVGWTSKD